MSLLAACISGTLWTLMDHDNTAAARQGLVYQSPSTSEESTQTVEYYREVYEHNKWRLQQVSFIIKTIKMKLHNTGYLFK